MLQSCYNFRNVDLNIGVASAGVFSADAVTTKAMGFNPADIGLFHYASEMGIGVADLSQIEVLGTPIEDVTLSFRPHEKVEFQFQWQETNSRGYLEFV